MRSQPARARSKSKARDRSNVFPVGQLSNFRQSRQARSPTRRQVSPARVPGPIPQQVKFETDAQDRLVDSSLTSQRPATLPANELHSMQQQCEKMRFSWLTNDDGEQVNVISYQKYRLLKIPSQVSDQAEMHVKSLRFPESFYPTADQRKALIKILCCLQGRYPDLRLDDEFVTFVASVHTVIEKEPRTFQFVAAVFDQLQLGEYLSHDADAAPGSYAPAVEEDSRRVMWSLSLHFEDIVRKFEEHDCIELLHTCIKGWLKSLLTWAFHGTPESWRGFTELLQHLFAASPSESDPRAKLRYIVACIIGRHVKEFRGADSVQALEEVLNQVRKILFVDRALLRIIEEDFDSPMSEFLATAVSLPFVATMGFDLASNDWVYYACAALGTQFTLGLVGAGAGVAGLIAVQRLVGTQKIMSMLGFGRVPEEWIDYELSELEAKQRDPEVPVESDASIHQPSSSSETPQEHEPEAEAEDSDSDPDDGDLYRDIIEKSIRDDRIEKIEKARQSVQELRGHAPGDWGLAAGSVDWRNSSSASGAPTDLSWGQFPYSGHQMSLFLDGSSVHVQSESYSDSSFSQFSTESAARRRAADAALANAAGRSGARLAPGNLPQRGRFPTRAHRASRALSPAAFTHQQQIDTTVSRSRALSPGLGFVDYQAPVQPATHQAPVQAALNPVLPVGLLPASGAASASAHVHQPPARMAPAPPERQTEAPYMQTFSPSASYVPPRPTRGPAASPAAQGPQGMNQAASYSAPPGLQGMNQAAAPPPPPPYPGQQASQVDPWFWPQRSDESWQFSYQAEEFWPQRAEQYG
mmetsp:Transcript_64573/g.117821  ORF Transcript_64573/g.117821 Transcript_64573/m.117821 type:complete len:810 (+) Transcript_64573:64-2493(+)